ncbi:hypothetical protein [Thermophilibacter provencensis]|uniref:Uncharacterized protein n=1 Tax=Thermophilibacter provencensis TaxID=1852386 RepID=A0ABT7V1T1_9ACTN|nr:hypothetical protein [Thermophilibacter provencensis]MDM8270571.1 hypothetical protein [Thermophilibacter provencensis]
MAGDGRARRRHGEPDCMGLYEGGECELCLFRRECRLRAWEVEDARERATEASENGPESRESDRRGDETT